MRCRRVAALAAAVTALTPAVAAPDAGHRESADGAALVEVQAPGTRGAMALERRGLDVVEIEPATVEVMLHSGRDRAALEASGYEHEVLVEDIGKADRKQRAAEERAEAALAEDPALASALPTGRVL